MVRVLISTVSEVARTTNLESASNKLNIHFLGDDDYHFSDKKFPSIIGRLMLQRLLIEANLGEDILQTLHRGPYGKLQLSAAVDFNVSHSEDKVVAVFSSQRAIGVDVEKIRSFEWREYSELFSSTDWGIITSANDPEKTFFDFWTKKESLLKAYGFGLQIPLNQVAIHDNVGRIENTSMTGFFREIKIPEYICYICTPSDDYDLRVENFIV
jgi:4'-phosphopantetheinyl transferase